MMADAILIQLPWYQLPLWVIIPLAALAGVIWGLRRLIRPAMTAGEPPDWSVPPLEVVRSSPLHRWDVRCKIVTIVVYCFFIAALTHMGPALMALAFSLSMLVLAKSSPVRVLARMLAIAGFVTMLAVVMPFSVPAHSGDTILVFQGLPWLSFNLRGLQQTAVIAAKAMAIAMLMEPLFSTAPLPITLHGLARLGAPEMVGQMVLLSHRYLHVFRHEASRMAAGMRVRGFRKRCDLATLQAVANFLGMLFVRSFERTERVMDAMRARGYNGRFPDPIELQLRAGDVIGSGIWLVVAVALTIYDRLPW